MAELLGHKQDRTFDNIQPETRIVWSASGLSGMGGRLISGRSLELGESPQESECAQETESYFSLFTLLLV